MPPDETKSTFAPWDESSQDAIDILRQVTNSASFWESLSTYYSEENHETFIIQDNVSCVKSICEYMSHKRWQLLTALTVQVLEDEPFESLKPIVERLIADKEQNKQRGAAEFIAGVIGGKIIITRMSK